MSNTAQSSNLPLPAPARPRSLKPFVALAAILAIVFAVGNFAVQNATALAAMFRSDREAKQAMRQFLDAVCAADAKGADATSANIDPDAKATLLRVMPYYGEVKNVSFLKANYLSYPDRTLYYFEAFVHFRLGSTRIDSQVFKVGDAWKVRSLGFDNLPRMPRVGSMDREADAKEILPTTLPSFQPPPPMTIDVNKHYTATIVTSVGSIVLDLFPKEAPITVNNFVTLARNKFYDGVTFHRVVPDFMIQGGDPTATGSGGPGYSFQDEVDPATNPHEFQAGTLAMANAGPNTNGSQFFITYVPTPFLRGRHTVFGQLHDEKSMAVLNQLRRGDAMKTITIEESK